MYYSTCKENEIMYVDLHKLSVVMAKDVLTKSVLLAPSDVKEIVVIHGYHRGTELQQMVRKDFKCKKVARKYLSLNQGITVLIMAQWKDII